MRFNSQADLIWTMILMYMLKNSGLKVNFDNETNPNLLWQIFHDNISQTIRYTKKNSIRKYKEPWFTNGQLELMTDQYNLALKKGKITKNSEDWKKSSDTLK